MQHKLRSAVAQWMSTRLEIAGSLGHNSAANKRKITGSKPNLDLVNINAYTE